MTTKYEVMDPTPSAKQLRSYWVGKGKMWIDFSVKADENSEWVTYEGYPLKEFIYWSDRGPKAKVVVLEVREEVKYLEHELISVPKGEWEELVWVYENVDGLQDLGEAVKDLIKAWKEK